MKWFRLIAPVVSVLLLAQAPDPAQERKNARKKQAEELARKMSRGEGNLKAGDDAVDFDLAYAGGKTGRVQLAKFFGKRPVALIFGSFT
jgi:hypothetical protein